MVLKSTGFGEAIGMNKQRHAQFTDRCKKLFQFQGRIGQVLAIHVGVDFNTAQA